MQVDKELCFKFPAILRDKLLNNEIELPDTAQFEYDDLYTYRAVERLTDDLVIDFKIICYCLACFNIFRTPI